MLAATLRNKATNLLTILVRTEHVRDLLRPLRRAAPLDNKYAPMTCSHNVTMVLRRQPSARSGARWFHESLTIRASNSNKLVVWTEEQYTIGVASGYFMAITQSGSPSGP